MTRRTWFRSVIASAVALVCPVPALAEAVPSNLRPFKRWDAVAGTWESILPTLIRPLDVVWDVENNLVVRVSRVDHPNQQFFSDVQIDPATNQWVPVDF